MESKINRRLRPLLQIFDQPQNIQQKISLYTLLESTRVVVDWLLTGTIGFRLWPVFDPLFLVPVNSQKNTG
uniref:Uncharacterized protein n=1 Tax=Meloidogyne enterolobii TaxID=390850 RepID=A0A6V7VWY4_MELEN|nr:unnamed protein product [Meloidogyne enterolobii]